MLIVCNDVRRHFEHSGMRSERPQKDSEETKKRSDRTKEIKKERERDLCFTLMTTKPR